MVVGTIVYTFGIGMIEETTYRGVIRTTFHQKWAGAPNGIVKAVLVSSLYFGAVHLANFFSGANLVLTLAQVFYTVVLGIFFGVLLVYSKSIWPGIVAHWLLDCAAGLVGLGKSPETNVWVLTLLFVGAVLPIGIAALWMLRQTIRRQLEPDNLPA